MVVKELVALLGIKTDKKGFDQAENGLGKVIKIAKAAAAAFAALKVVQFAKGVIEETAAAGDAIDKLSKRSGIATTALQGWAHAAELSGASLKDVEMTIKRLQAAQVEAADGVATYADEFKRLGVEVKDSEGNFKDTPALLLEMADAMNGLDSQAEKTNVAMKLMGRSGTTLLPMLAEGTEGIREMMEEMKTLGGVMDEDLIKASADYVDNQRRMDVAMMGIKNAITKEILPAVNSLTSGFIDFWKANGQIIRQHMGTVFGGIGRVIMSNVRFFGRLVKTVFEFAANMSPLQKRILGVGTAITILGALIMAGPVGKILLLIAAIGLLIEDFEVWRKGGKSVIGDLFKWLTDLTGIDYGFEAVADSFARVWSFISGIFKTNIGVIVETIAALVDLLINVWDDPVAAFGKFADMMAGIWGDWWEGIKESFDAIFVDIEGFFESLWGSITGFLTGVKDFIVGWSREAADLITAPFKAAGEWLGLLDDKPPSGGVQSAAGEWLGLLDDKSPSGGVQSAAAAGARGLLGSVSPKGSPRGGIAGSKALGRAGSSSLINAPNTTISVEVKASPGMDEKRLGQEVAKQITKHTDKQNRAAMRVFTRSPSGAGA